MTVDRLVSFVTKPTSDQQNCCASSNEAKIMCLSGSLALDGIVSVKYSGMCSTIVADHVDS